MCSIHVDFLSFPAKQVIKSPLSWSGYFFRGITCLITQNGSQNLKVTNKRMTSKVPTVFTLGHSSSEGDGSKLAASFRDAFRDGGHWGRGGT